MRQFAYINSSLKLKCLVINNPINTVSFTSVETPLLVGWSNKMHLLNSY